MNTKHVDLLNLGLIGVSLTLAIFLPFELFLFSYAFLGPAHYLTEINWLKQHDFFTKARNWSWVFIPIAVGLSSVAVMRMFGWEGTDTYQSVREFVLLTQNEMLLAAFLFSAVVLFFRSVKALLIGGVLSVVVAIVVMRYVPLTPVIIGTFLATIIHVYLFTTLFMVSGALKSKNVYAIWSVIAMLLVPFFIMEFNVDPAGYDLSPGTAERFLDSRFQFVNQKIAFFLGAADPSQQYELRSVVGIKVQIFIAFAYTYHYLNWFSKISVIKWAKGLDKKRIIGFGLIWLAAIALYLIDYSSGLAALLILSFLHVLLEFPLNILVVTNFFKKSNRL